MTGHESDSLTDLACDRIRRLAAGEKPFALFVAYQAPHPPCSPPEEYEALYQDHDGKLRPNVPDDPPGYAKPGWNAVYPQREFARRYAGEVSHLDDCIGSLLGTLSSEGLDKNTIVVFTSDHGELAGSHGLFGKEVMLEESVHVPLLVRVPRRSPERTNRLFATVDFYPTILSILGAQKGSAHRGADFSDLWLGRETEAGDGRYIFSEYKTRCAMDGKYKLVTDLSMKSILELYDLVTDPYEMTNRKDDPAVAGEIERMSRELKSEFCNP
jgi:arylsulfatase A-like enzyme